jgi:GT2 family glycosyltransferase
VSEHSSDLDLEYVVEERPGLSWARNRAIDVSSSDIIAWLDDDERADRWWVAELAKAFVDHPEAGAVSGIILPAEIESSAQLWYEEGGGHHKGREFDPLVFSPATRQIQSPLYPRPAFGTGGNMAFRRESIESIGRFNTALGAGTAAMGAEDTAAFSELLYAGGTVVYQPAAIVWHTHRSDIRALRDLKRGYGRGLSAFYLSILLRHPEALLELVRLLPKAIRDISPSNDTDDGEGSADKADLYAHDLYRGIIEGGPMYLIAAARARRLAKLGQQS